MQIRLAQPSDHDTLGIIAASACTNDPMDAFLYPKRHLYPDAYRKFYREQVRFYSEERAAWIVVAVSDPPHPGTDGGGGGGSSDEILGWAHWRHEGATRSEKSTLPFSRRVAHWLESRTVVELLHDLLNPATSFRASWAFDTSEKAVRLDDPGWKKPEEYWYLEKLAVAPTAQRKGVGGALVRWGMERAEKEKLKVLLEATEVGRGLYEKLGFVRYGVWKWGKGEQMYETKMVWEPGRKDKEDMNGANEVSK